jgi:ferredoxin-NADP reductase
MPIAQTMDALPPATELVPRAETRALRSRIAGLADLFAWPLRVSHYLELANPLWSTHTLRARVLAVHAETADARTIVLRPGRGWRPHRAGQFVPVTVSAGGQRHVRTYSISTAPGRGERRDDIAITVKAIPRGIVSNHLVRDVSPGDYVTLGLPQGEFVLPESAPVRPLFLTAGSGITPVMGMLRDLEARGALDDVVHVHWAPHRADVIFAAELARLARAFPGYDLHVVTTRENDPVASAPQHHFSAASLDARCPDWRQRDVFACGPQALLDAASAHWTSAGLAARLHVERFHAPLARRPDELAGGRVLFRASGVAVDADGATSLLRVAEAAGLNPPHGCRMGICHTCTATLRAGCVRDVRDNRLVTEPGTRVQICVSAAAGACELEL